MHGQGLFAFHVSNTEVAIVPQRSVAEFDYLLNENLCACL
jgi:hypothetical protein